MKEAQEQVVQHYYVLANVQAKEAPVIELGTQIKPKPESTTPTKVKKFCQDMKELLESFNQLDSEFHNFIAQLLQKVPSVASITQQWSSLARGRAN